MNVELFNERQEESEDTVVTVSQLTASIKDLLEGAVGTVSVRGEISNWRPAASGHIYFSLKDSEAVISAALFRGAALKNKQLAALKDGVEVVCAGRISVYPPRGTYQVIVEQIKPVGEGGLQAKFEALKKKLHAEGLFDQARKREIPAFPRRIVVITSPTGAAIRDVISVLKRRFSGVNVLLIPALVQGAEAPKDLRRALELANEHGLGDVILLTRGGGSLEDLFCFNDEELARAIHKSAIPVVSAVGHEIDFTIADFVADLRAPTPSAAAELLVREQEATLELVGDLRSRLENSVIQEVEQAQLRLNALLASLKNPRDRINELRLRFDDWAERLGAAAIRCLEKNREQVALLQGKLGALSPLEVLERGYSIAFDEAGRAIRSAAKLPPGTRFELRLHDGTVEADSR
ncbi:MAG TPA: exodeoxyribonuclease VII large subunit [Bdellovibrionota bacterium]